MAWSGQERIAYLTGEQDGIFGRPRDNPYNIAVTPRSHRAYEEGFDEGTGSTIPPRGPAGVAGPQGDQGSQGQPGINGTNGANGLNMHQSTGVPAGSLGIVGESYVDSVTGDLYKKTGVSTWTLTGNLADGVSFAVQLDDTGGAPNVLYLGEALPGALTSAAAWRVQQITIQSDNDTAILWADGDADLDNIWDNRLSLSYS